MDENQPLVAMHGWLKLKTSPFRFDKRFYCVITETDFLMYTNESMTTLERNYPLSSIHSVSSISTASAPGFHFFFSEDQGLTFLCQNIPQTQRWLCALRAEPNTENVSIDSFELIKVIGKGSSGKVYLARHKRTSILYAIKKIVKDFRFFSNKASRARAERNVLMRSVHPFFTRLFFAFQTATKCYFVLEYAPGGDLRHHFNNKMVFSRAQIQLYLAEIAVALKTLHSMGIIYRDLKPENILLDEAGHIKLTDFGFAYEIEDDKTPTSLCGTCEYVAPEMLRGEHQSFTVDWWSYGVIAFRFLVGYLPFRSANRARLYEMISSGVYRIPASLDSVSTSFINELLQTDPTKRLGAVGRPVAEHEFFSGIDWGKVERKEYVPEFIPQISREDSVSNFDEEYTRLPATDSYVEAGSVSMNLQNFSYVAHEFPIVSPSFDGEYTGILTH